MYYPFGTGVGFKILLSQLFLLFSILCQDLPTDHPKISLEVVTKNPISIPLGKTENNSDITFRWQNNRSIILANSSNVSCWALASKSFLWNRARNGTCVVDTNQNIGLCFTNRGDIVSIDSESGNLSTLIAFEKLNRLLGSKLTVSRDFIFQRPNNELVVVANRGYPNAKACVVNIQKESLVRTLALSPYLTNLNISKNGEFLVSTDLNGGMVGYDCATGQKFIEYLGRKVSPDRIRFSMDRERFGKPFYDENLGILVYPVCRGWGKGKLVIEHLKAKKKFEIEIESGYMPLDVGFESQCIVVARSDGVLEFIGFDGKLISKFTHSLSSLRSIRFSADGTKLLIENQKAFQVYRFSKL